MLGKGKSGKATQPKEVSEVYQSLERMGVTKKDLEAEGVNITLKNGSLVFENNGKGKPGKLSLGKSPKMSIDELSRQMSALGLSVGSKNDTGFSLGGEYRDKSAEAAYDQGVDLVSAGQYVQAIEKFKQAVSIYPEYTDAHFNLAMNYNRIGNQQMAKKEYEIVLLLNDMDTDALNNLGTIYALEGQLEKAKEYFDKAFNIDAENALTCRNLAAYYKEKGDLAMMSKFALKATKLQRNIFSK